MLCVLFFLHLNAFACSHVVGKDLAATPSAEGGRGCGQEGVTAAMATDDPTPLRLPRGGRAGQ